MFLVDTEVMGLGLHREAPEVAEHILFSLSQQGCDWEAKQRSYSMHLSSVAFFVIEEMSWILASDKEFIGLG